MKLDLSLLQEMPFLFCARISHNSRISSIVFRESITVLNKRNQERQ